MNFAIQILNFNNYQVTIQAIQAIKKNQYNYLDIFILDNGSSNNSYNKLIEFVKKEKMEAKIYIRLSEQNLGYPGGHNYIYKWIKKTNLRQYDFYFILNSDAFIPTNFFRKFLHYYKKMKTNSLVYGFNIFDAENMKQSSVIQSWNKFFGFARNHSKMPSDFSNIFWQYYPSGCALMIRPDFFKKLGALDKSLFFYGDEVDMCMKLNLKGGNFTICEDIKIDHSYGKSTFLNHKKRNQFNEFYYQRSKLILMYKYFPYRVILVRLSLIPIIFWRLFFGYFDHLSLLLKIFFLPISKLKSMSHNDLKIK